jgi:hypothetical protein
MTVLTVRASSVPAVSGKALHGIKEVKHFHSFHNDDDEALPPLQRQTLLFQTTCAAFYLIAAKCDTTIAAHRIRSPCEEWTALFSGQS